MSDQEWLNNWGQDVARSDTSLRSLLGFATMCGKNPITSIRKSLNKTHNTLTPKMDNIFPFLIIAIGIIIGILISCNSN